MCADRQTDRQPRQFHVTGRFSGKVTFKVIVSCGVVRETVSTETQVEVEASHDVEVQTALSPSPVSVPTSPRSPGTGAAVLGSQWPPHQQHQQMLQQLLLQRHQQRVPASGRPPCAPSSPRSPGASIVPPGHGGSAEKPRKGSASDFATTDFGRTLCVSAATNSAFRPVLTTRAADWSPSRRTQHEPRLPYFEVRDVTGDAGKRFFRPIADGVVVTTGSEPPASTDDVFEDSKPLATADSTTSCVNHVSSAVRSSDINTTGSSRDVPADTVIKTRAERSPAVSSRTEERPLPPAAELTSKSHKTSAQSRSTGTKLRRAYRSKTAELRIHRPPMSTGSVSNVPAVQKQVPASREDHKWSVDDENEDALFGSEAGSVASVSARSRTKSDSSVTHSLRSAASQRTTVGPPIAAGSSSSLLAVVDVPQDHGGRRRSAGWALDRGPPDGDSTTDGGARSLRTSPFRQSPSPLIVRKLKSAAELLRECNELHQQRRSRHASSASSIRPPVTVTGPQKSYCITGTLATPPSSTASAIPTSPSAEDTTLNLDPQTVTTESTPVTDSAVPTLDMTTGTSSTLEQQACITFSVDIRPTETHSQPSSTIESEKSEFRTETTIPGETASTGDAGQRTVIHVMPQSAVTTQTQTVQTARSTFSDGNWFHVTKFFKTPK